MSSNGEPERAVSNQGCIVLAVLTVLAMIAWFGVLFIGMFAIVMAGPADPAAALKGWDAWDYFLALLAAPVVGALVGWVGVFWDKPILVLLGTISLIAWLTLLLLWRLQLL